MYPILFSVGSLTFYTHGVFAVVGIIFGIIFIYNILKKEVASGYILDNIIISVALGILGARLAYVMAYWDQYSSYKEALSFYGGGFVSFGGMITGAIVLALILKAQKENILHWFDVTATGFFLGLAMGRIGEIFAGEFSGVATNSNFLQAYLGTGVVAVPVFETLLCVLLFSVGFYILKQKNKYKEGFALSVLLLFYFGIRFIIDFQRVESKLFMDLSLGQMVSIVLFIFSAIVLLKIKRREPNGQESVFN